MGDNADYANYGNSNSNENDNNNYSDNDDNACYHLVVMLHEQ